MNKKGTNEKNITMREPYKREEMKRVMKMYNEEEREDFFWIKGKKRIIGCNVNMREANKRKKMKR